MISSELLCANWTYYMQRRGSSTYDPPPGNRLETLSGDLARYYSIRVNDQWRIIFRWENSDSLDVLLTDYHRIKVAVDRLRHRQGTGDCRHMAGAT